MANAKKINVYPLTIGSIVRDIISMDQGGIVHGITSRGLFIKTESHRILYLTSDPFKGPLTVNLDKDLPFRQRISPGTPVYLNQANILIPEAGLEIACSDTMVWEAALPDALILPGQEQERRLRSLGEQIMSLSNGTGLSWLLPYLFETPGTSSPSDALKQRQLASALDLRRSFRAGDIAAISSSLSEFLGHGPGLTPSGDDFVLGVMLSLNRMKDGPVNDAGLKNLNRAVIESAYRLTTTLSANLIECSARGLADERLLRAMDWIKSDIPEGDHLLDGLLGWGHSSGVDVFTGFVTVLSTSGYSSDHS
jgi:hypothetical protein